MKPLSTAPRDGTPVLAVIVNGYLVRLYPGADLSEMVRRVASAQNAHHVRVAKRRARKSR